MCWWIASRLRWQYGQKLAWQSHLRTQVPIKQRNPHVHSRYQIVVSGYEMASVIQLYTNQRWTPSADPYYNNSIGGPESHKD